MATPGLEKDIQLAMYALNEAEDAIETALTLAQRERDQLELQKEQRRNMPKTSFSQWPGDILTWPRFKKDALKVRALVPESKDQYTQLIKLIGPQEWKERARFFKNSEDPVTGILNHFELMLPSNTSALPTLEKRISELPVGPQDVPVIVSNAQVILGVINEVKDLNLFLDQRVCIRALWSLSPEVQKGNMQTFQKIARSWLQ